MVAGEPGGSPAPQAADRRALFALLSLLQPAPWLLALLLVAILVVLWLFAVTRFLSAGAWDDASAWHEAG